MTLTDQDYLAANRLHFWCVIRSWKTFRAILISCIALTIAILLQVQPSSRMDTVITVSVGLAVGIIAMIGGYGIAYRRLPRRSRKLFATNKLLQQETGVVIEADTVNTMSASGTYRIPYAMTYRWTENADILLLYSAENAFFIMPRRCMSDQQHAAIVSGLERAGVPRFDRPSRPA